MGYGVWVCIWDTQSLALGRMGMGQNGWDGMEWDGMERMVDIPQSSFILLLMKIELHFMIFDSWNVLLFDWLSCGIMMGLRVHS